MAIAFAVAVVALVGFLWWGANRIIAGNDAAWRERIVSASSRLRALVATQGDAVQVSDAELIEKLGETDAELKGAQAELARAQAALRRDATRCPRIPASCLH